MSDAAPSETAPPMVAVFGCGYIGSAADEGADARAIVTHAAACVAGGARLVAVCEPDPDRRVAASRARAVPGYTQPDALLAHHTPDIAVIATPATHRLALVRRAIEAGVGTLVVEKPVAASLEEATDLERLVAASPVRAHVPYLRRYLPALEALRLRVQSGALGAPQHVVVTYGKGLSTNGSHALDLLHHWLGTPKRARAGRRIDDGHDHDPTLDAVVDFGEWTAHLVGTDHRRFSLFEIDFVFERGRIRLTDRSGRATIGTPGADPIFPGYEVLHETEAHAPDIAAGMLHFWRAVLASPAASTCSVADGVAVLRVVDAILRSHRRDGAWESL